MSSNEGFQGVSNCYVFKSQLQEYAQKVGMPTPVYETTKEGPSHEPSFKSTVIVNDVRYDSLPGFSNRKVAEQSAAEVALMELAKSGDFIQSISQPIHETGLCKNLLQEYAQKMNYAIPLYQCQKEDASGRVPLFSCTVEIGGIRYVGAVAKTKKEAEIKVARIALLAIRSSKPESSMEPAGDTQLTVLPSKKRRTESNTISEETANVPKPKKARFKKKKLKKKFSGNKVDKTQVENVGNFEVNMGRSELPGWRANACVDPMAAEATKAWMPKFIQSENKKSAWERGFVLQVNDASAKNGQSSALLFNHGDNGTPDAGSFPISCGNITPSEEVNMVSGAFPQVNDVSAKNGQSTAAYINHGNNETLDAESFPISHGTITTSATEVNLVSGAFPQVNDDSAPSAEEVNMVSGAFPQVNDASAKNGQSTAAYINHGDNGTLDAESFPISHGNITPSATEVNLVSGAFPQVHDASTKNGQSTAAYINHGDDETLDAESFPISHGNITPSATEVNLVSGAFPQVNDDSAKNGQSAAASYFNHGDNGTVDVVACPLSNGNTTPLAKEVNMVSGAGEAVALGNNSGAPYLEASSVMAGLNQSD